MSVVHGNYHGYYSKRPFVKDPRLALLPPATFANKTVLDIGCNDGLVTCEIAAQCWGAIKVIGVDIDETLVRAAWRRRIAVWSQQAPQSVLSKRKREAENEAVNTVQLVSDYFPLAIQHSLGPLPIPPSDEQTKNIFPHNVLFRTSDWVNDGIPEDTYHYDVVVAFSVSKWIHLNEGDKGLMSFFTRLSSVLKTGGTLVFEPQAWETYKHSKRLDDKLKENAKGLQLRPDDFDSILQSLDFSAPQDLGFVGEGGFRRPVKLYVKV